MPESIAYLEEARAILERFGANDAPLWPTEVGWRVGARGRYTMPTGRAQARALTDFAVEAERRRTELRLGPVFGFVLRDRTRPGENYGLMRVDRTVRPAFAAWSAVARGSKPLAQPEQRGCRADAG